MSADKLKTYTIYMDRDGNISSRKGNGLTIAQKLKSYTLLLVTTCTEKDLLNIIDNFSQTINHH